MTKTETYRVIVIYSDASRRPTLSFETERSPESRYKMITEITKAAPFKEDAIELYIVNKENCIEVNCDKFRKDKPASQDAEGREGTSGDINCQ